MTTTLTRQQLVAQLMSLCSISFMICVMFFMGFQDWLRSNPRYWAFFAVMILLAGTLVFAFRRLLNSFQPKS